MLLLADLVALAVVAAYAVRGFMRGLIGSLLHELGLALSLFAAWLLWGWAGRRLIGSFGAPVVLGYALGALFVFLIVHAVFVVLVYFIRRRRKARRAQAGVKPKYPWADKVSGAAFGACFGILTAALLVCLYNVASLTPTAAAWPDIRDSAASRLSSPVIRAVSYVFARVAANDPALSRIIARTMSNPKAAAEDARRIKQNPDVAALAQDARFTDAVLRGDRKAIEDNPRLNRLLENPEFLRSARDLRLLPAESATVSTREQAAEELVRAGRRISRIRTDPEIQDALRDGVIRKMVEDGDLSGLAQDERVWKIGRRAMQIIRTNPQ